MNNLSEIFVAGGFVMYPLAICSLITWAVALERWWNYRKIGAESYALSEKVQAFLKKNDSGAALEECLRSQVPLARVLEDLIKANKESTFSLEQLTQRAHRRRLELNFEYKRNLWILGTIGSATPFLGLFGTVVGILRAFHQISEKGEAGFAVVASGISEALVATAVGIIVAVIAVAFYNYFQVKVSRIVLESRLALDEFIESLALGVGAK